jgi:HPt (histidine-containing phosphotransfer) domain-containing protein
MTESVYKVKVAKDLEDLIPTFLSNRNKELEALRSALAAADFEQLRQIGHRMRGVGRSYGFERVSDIGKCIEDGARHGDKAALETQLADYGDYLSRVQIAYE